MKARQRRAKINKHMKTNTYCNDKINKQTLKLQEKLNNNNKLSEIVFFDNEGHGFKYIENKKKVLQKTEDFLNKVLNI